MTTLKYFLMICSICILTIATAYPQMNSMNENEIIIQDDQAQLFLDDELIAENKMLLKFGIICINIHLIR